jgi:hypothetical protein
MKFAADMTRSDGGVGRAGLHMGVWIHATFLVMFWKLPGLWTVTIAII